MSRADIMKLFKMLDEDKYNQGKGAATNFWLFCWLNLEVPGVSNHIISILAQTLLFEWVIGITSS